MISNIRIRCYSGESDIFPFLELRHSAFARQRVGVRKWSREDFHSEFAGSWWWRPDHMWLAETLDVASADSQQHPLVGSVTLAMRGQPGDARPVIHWLMVLPTYRRRGIGRLLIAHLERAAWDAGHRTIWLETHADWEAAAKFYDSLGYHPEHH